MSLISFNQGFTIKFLLKSILVFRYLAQTEYNCEQKKLLQIYEDTYLESIAEEDNFLI